jgi:hypothetical protein
MLDYITEIHHIGQIAQSTLENMKAFVTFVRLIICRLDRLEKIQMT